MSLDDSSSVPPPPPETEIGRPLVLTKDYYLLLKRKSSGVSRTLAESIYIENPKWSEAAEEYSLKLKRFVEALKPYVWSF